MALGADRGFVQWKYPKPLVVYRKGFFIVWASDILLFIICVYVKTNVLVTYTYFLS